MSQYTLYVTVIRSNGTDFNLDSCECESVTELAAKIISSLSMAEELCVDETTFKPSSITLTVLPR